jgi:imidazolonepropionase-like amidohydrolase
LANASFADTVVVTADRMLDVIAGKVVDHPQVTITDGRITAVGSQGGVIPAGARRVDLFIPTVTTPTSSPRW